MLEWNENIKIMIIPSTEDYQKIQGGIINYNDVHMSVCGSGCSCPCKQTGSIKLRYIAAYTCSCNCTCGCNCNAPILQHKIRNNAKNNLI